MIPCGACSNTLTNAWGILWAFQTSQDNDMTLCPIAIVTGCAKCPAFKICPLKGVIGDQVKSAAPQASDKKSSKAKK